MRALLKPTKKGLNIGANASGLSFLYWHTSVYWFCITSGNDLKLMRLLPKSQPSVAIVVKDATRHFPSPAQHVSPIT